MHLHLDPLGGIAGDMFTAALLDAFPGTRQALAATLAPIAARLGFKADHAAHHDGILSGSRWLVTLPPEERGHDHGHGHRPWREIRRLLHEASLPAGILAHALSIFGLLAEAEAAIHGVAVDAVVFHEVGGLDSIADIVAAACLIDEMDGASWSVGTLPLGSGRIKTAHGLLPVPAPATSRLLTGFRFADDGIDGERVTPTGAAILRHLCEPGRPRPTGRLACRGYGFGSRRLPGISNCLAVLALDDQPEPNLASGTVGVITFEVDDQSPEDLALGLERLRARSDVLDVLQIPAFGKKGRLALQVQILCDAGAIPAVTDAVFLETSTIGLRQQEVQRRILPRESLSIASDAGSLRIKRTQRPDGTTSLKVEADDLHGDMQERQRLRRHAEDDPGPI
ncbi:hypothetical protein SAMN07250955_107102 [Arboricoccus pini]|uniref:LarC family nickel insertion protein n=1 Tax=Arboricoccus pini TaxID=1963835 RepID=A0A212RD82_9PROT|nr:LarC family nickel insertion protein [Arboricoccus pini]SNB70051.1 hypothetical protein SAMN07250955_107102 [Arboricoccus pini]